MILGTIRSAMAMIALLRLAQQGPRTTSEFLESLDRLGLSFTAKALYPLLRRLSVEGCLTSALHLEQGRPGVRRYWSTRRGNLAADHFRAILAILAGPLPALRQDEGHGAQGGIQSQV